MSKAFTRESDDIPERPVLPQPVSPVPAGAKNYLTRAGSQRLREELERLVEIERPRLTGLPEGSESKRQIQAVDQRIRHLQQSLQTAVVVEPPAELEDRVRFGAMVTVRDSDGEEEVYQIVGVDEIDLDRGQVSWLSPVAKALLNARVGERVRFKLPSGEKELQIVGVRYDQ
jgi:transcription elongation factor GreB